MKPHTLITAALAASCGFGATQATTPDDETTDGTTAAESPGQTGPRWQALDGSGGGSGGGSTAELADSSSTAEPDASSSETAELADSSSTTELADSGSETDSSSTNVGSETSSSSTATETETGSTTGPDPCACCNVDGDPGCELPDVEDCTCAWDDGVTNASYCCIGAWAEFCVDVAQQYCGLDCSAC